MAEISAQERARVHALLDETIDREHDIVGIAIVIELGSQGGEIKLRALLTPAARRLRQIVDKIRGR